MAGLFTQRSMHALSTLSSLSQTQNPIPEKTSSTAIAPSSSTAPGSTHRPSSAKARDDNPFLELPARKLYKRGPENTSVPSLTTSTSVKGTTGHGIFKRPATGGGQEPLPWKPQRLILTRVLPSNNIIRTAEGAAEGGAWEADSATPSSSSVSISAFATASACAPPIALSKSPELERDIDSGFALKSDIYTHQTHAQHPSTTPKAPPNQEYYDFIMKGLSINTDLKEKMNVTSRLDAEDQAMAWSETAQKNGSQTHLHQQKEQLEQQEGELEEIVPLNSNIMAFARKSIMQHATSSPNSIFRKLNKTAAAATSSSNSAHGLLASRSNPVSNLAKVPSKPTVTKNDRGLKEKGARDHSRDVIAVPETAFTFGSRPSPTTTPTAVPIATTKILAPTAATTLAENPKANDALCSELGPTGRTASGMQQSTLPASIFSRSVLDFSQTQESDIQKRGSGLSNIAVISDVSTSKEAAGPRKPEAFSTSTSHLNMSRQEFTMPSMPGTESYKDTNQLAAVFNLRSALRMDSARTQYNLPSLIASLSPPASPKRRPSPYVVPSANERDVLRSRRMPCFKARPLDPKVFTSAGDLGVPRIPKLPLTVPRSPTFSKTRTKSAFAEGRLKKEAAMNSTAATWLKGIVKAGAARETPLGIQRVVNQRPHQFRAKSIIRSQGKVDSGSSISGGTSKESIAAPSDGEHQSSAGATDSPTWHIPLIVPSVAPSLTTIKTHLCAISGPPQREYIPSPTTSPATAMAPSRVKSVIATTVTTAKWRRPATKLQPFSFATTELQRRRMLFQPTSDTIAGATATVTVKSTASKIPRATRNKSSMSRPHPNALTLEDL